MVRRLPMAVLAIGLLGCGADGGGSGDPSGSEAAIADAGPDQFAAPSTMVALDGSASSGSPLTLLWIQTGGPVVVLSDDAAVRPTFTAPAQSARLEFALTVTDGRTQASDSVQVDVIAGRAYYVDGAAGDDANPGTEAQPFETPQHAADLVEPGDIVYVKAGVYKPAPSSPARIPVLDIMRSGLPGVPIVFRNHQADVVVFDTRDAAYPDGRYHAIKLGAAAPDDRSANGQDVHDVVVQGFVVEGASTMGIGVFGGINGVTTRNVVVRRCTVRGLKGSGISTKGTIEDLTLEECEAYGNWSTGIGFGYSSKSVHSGQPVDQREAVRQGVIRNCLSYDNVHPTQPGNTDGFVLGFAYRCGLEDCIAFGNSDDGFDVYSSAECRVERCISFGHRGAGNGAGVKLSAGGGGLHVVRHTISFDNKSYAFECSNPSNPLTPYARNEFYHNVAYGNGGRGFSLGSGFAGGPNRLRNNIGWRNDLNAPGGNGDDISGYGASETDSDYNFWGAFDFARLQGAGLEPHSISGDPLLLDAGAAIDTTWGPGWSLDQKLDHIRSQFPSKLGLQASSPCRDAGDDLGDPFQGTAPDIGRYERP